jgi:selT/selW/selH-like putative selenoprotein
LRDELYEAFRNYTDITIEIIPGDRGSFEVIVDKIMMFSKLDLDRFPNSGEIVNLIKE